MRVTSKGQFTVPKQVRDALGLGPGSDVGVVENERGEFVLVNLDARPNENKGKKLARHLREMGARAREEGWASGLTTEDIMDMTRGPFNDVDSH